MHNYISIVYLTYVLYTFFSIFLFCCTVSPFHCHLVKYKFENMKKVLERYIRAARVYMFYIYIVLCKRHPELFLPYNLVLPKFHLYL